MDDLTMLLLKILIVVGGLLSLAGLSGIVVIPARAYRRWRRERREIAQRVAAQVREIPRWECRRCHHAGARRAGRCAKHARRYWPSISRRWCEMAEFEQSEATRGAAGALLQHITRSSTAQIAREAGVSQRWQSYLTGKGSQQRKPSQKSLHKLAKATPGEIKLKLGATLVIGGDPKYSRKRTGIVVPLDADEAPEMLEHALGDEEDQDEAWQDFFNAYAC